ncbi:hypothetical protein CCR75_009624 [Bremia lactucae]|uniref:RxLR effector protein n=1 Tax=Bremia lactucae TaxID=4779 RepID=A0A976FMM9_BRELC|nr:hypothetical protein CCR75_009624 [Bremia lactucae]
MVRVYVAALTAFLAFSASATVQLTLASDPPVNGTGRDAPASRSLQGFATINEKTEERDVMEIIKASARAIKSHLSRPNVDIQASSVRGLEIPLDEILNLNRKELHQLIKRLKKSNKYPVSLYEQLVLKHGALNVENAMRIAKSGKNDADVMKYLLEEEKAYRKNWAKAGTIYARELKIQEDGVKVFETNKISVLQAYLARISPGQSKVSQDQKLIEVLSAEYGGEKFLALHVVQASSLGLETFSLKLALVSKWEKYDVPLDYVWSYFCRDVNAPTTEEVEMFSQFYGYAFVLSSKGKLSFETTESIESSLLKIYKDSASDVAFDMLIQIRLARRFQIPKSFTKLFAKPSDFPLDKFLFVWRKTYLKNSRQDFFREDFIEDLRKIFPDDRSIARAIVKGGQDNRDNDEFATVFMELEKELYAKWDILPGKFKMGDQLDDLIKRHYYSWPAWK